MAIRTLIVDDEPLARDKIRGFLDEETSVEIIGECRDGQEALVAIERDKPDLLFLDIQMPELDGFEVIDNLDPESTPPVVIFVTAYDQYAIKAFDVHAVDYLLKPYDRSRFRAALERARGELERRETEDLRSQLQGLLEDLKTQRGTEYPDRLVIKTSGRVVLVPVDEIEWVDAAGNYVRIHAGGDSYMMRETMSGLEKRLDPARFLRIHRSTIVALSVIKELQQQFHGDYLVILRNGQRLTLSRSYRDKVQELLEQ
ncbi:MAG: LytTR family DNA-binding domain-containing protein [Acidobacteriota bacterium]